MKTSRKDAGEDGENNEENDERHPSPNRQGEITGEHNSREEGERNPRQREVR